MERKDIDYLVQKVNNLITDLNAKQNQLMAVKSAQQTQSQLQDSNVNYHSSSALENAVNDFNLTLSSVGSMEYDVNRAISELDRRNSSLDSDRKAIQEAKNKGTIKSQYATSEYDIEKTINLYNDWKKELQNKVYELRSLSNSSIATSGLENLVGRSSSKGKKYSNVSLDEQLKYYQNSNNNNYSINKNQPAWITEIQYTIPNYRKAQKDYYVSPPAGSSYLNDNEKNSNSNKTNLVERLNPRYNNVANGIRNYLNLNIDGRYDG